MFVVILLWALYLNCTTCTALEHVAYLDNVNPNNLRNISYDFATSYVCLFAASG
jgi:hypothetical protein